MLEAIVLAGGQGTRLRSVVPDLPKPMAPIAGKPFLEILLGNLARNGFNRIIISLGYMAEIIQAHFQNNFLGMEIVYVVEDTPLGTGGAVRLAMTKCHADHTFVFNGDTFLDLEVAAIEKLWQQFRQPILVGRAVPDTSRYGRLSVQGGKIVGFHEKGMSGPGLINAGVYVLNRNQLNLYALGTAFSLESDYLEVLVSSKSMDLFVTSGQFIDIG